MTEQPTLRVAVVGAGAMGVNHARVLSTLKGAELAAVVDADLARAEWVASQFGGRPSSLLSACADQIDAAVVAVPSSLHVDVGCELLAMGIDCLIEKPLAPTADAGRVLVDQAARDGRVLLVGHVERFNPAVEQLGSILDGAAPPMALDARRMSAVSSRITDVDVVKDLMIHDLEIVLHLVGREPVDVVARGVTSSGDRSISYATAMLVFDAGPLATLTASRITQNQVRQLLVTTEDRLYSVNYSAQELQIFRQGRIGELASGVPDGQYVLDVASERVFVRRVEPLSAELAHFIACCRREVEPKVDGASALRVLQLADAIVEEVSQ